MATSETEAIRERMTTSRVSQRALARAMGDYQPNIAAILAGKQYVSAERLERMKAALDRLESQQTPASE